MDYCHEYFSGMTMMIFTPPAFSRDETSFLVQIILHASYNLLLLKLRCGFIPAPHLPVPFQLTSALKHLQCDIINKIILPLVTASSYIHPFFYETPIFIFTINEIFALFLCVENHNATLLNKLCYRLIVSPLKTVSGL